MALYAWLLTLRRRRSGHLIVVDDPDQHLENSVTAGSGGLHFGYCKTRVRSGDV